MTLLCRHLSAQEIVSGSRLPTGVFTPTTRRNCRQLVANRVHTADTQNSFVPSASAVCIGLNVMFVVFIMTYNKQTNMI